MITKIQRKKSKKDFEKVKFDLSISVLDNFLCYIFSQNENVSKKTFIKMKNFLDIIDDSIYVNDIQMEVRIWMIRTLLSSKLDKKINDIDMLVDSLSGSKYEEEISQIFDEINEMPDLSNDELIFIDEYISDRLTYSYLYKEQDSLEDCILKLRSGDYDSLQTINNRFDNVLSKLNQEIRNVKVQSKYNSLDFSTKAEDLDCAVNRTITDLRKSTNKLKTGIKYFNTMLGQGFQAGRVYLFLGLPKGFKSGILLNIALWAKKYNKDVTPTDKTKKPCILYLTMENSVNETLERIWSHYFGNDSEMKDYDFDTALKMLQDAGFNDNGVSIVVKYRPYKSINTKDMNDMIDDLANDEGYEVIMMIQDYVKRIRSTQNLQDPRLELGEVINEFITIAKDKNIPLITASQLNRSAFKVAEDMAFKKQKDVAKHLGASHVGESALMIENVDFGYLIAQEYKESTRMTYLSIKRIAARGKQSEISYFAHPFKENNGMALEEDYNLAKSLSLDELSDDLSKFNDGDDDSKEHKNKKRKHQTNKANNAELVNNMMLEL